MADRKDYNSGKTPMTNGIQTANDPIMSGSSSNNGGYNTFNFGDMLGAFGLGGLESIWNDVTGATSQQREFSQQEYLQDKQNEYNLPANQMARMKAAGINPLTAAGQISQGGNESAQAPQVSTNTQGVSQGLGALSGIAGAVTGGLADVAGASLAGAQAELAGEEATKIRTLLPIDVQLSLEGIGLTKAQSQALAIENHYRPQNLMLDIAQKKLTLPILKQQVKTLRGQYALSLAQAKQALQEVEESKGRVDLMTYQKNLFAAQAAYYNSQSQYTGALFQLMRDFRWDPSTGLGGLLAGQFISLPESRDRDEPLDNAFIDGILTTLYNMHFNISEGMAAGSFESKKGLIKAQEEADKAVNKEQRKAQFWNNTADKWIRVPSSASVGPFHMSTE